jgi:hypothetical protein
VMRNEGGGYRGRNDDEYTVMQNIKTMIDFNDSRNDMS